MLWRTFGGRSDPSKGRIKDSRIPSTWLGAAGSRKLKYCCLSSGCQARQSAKSVVNVLMALYTWGMNCTKGPQGNHILFMPYLCLMKTLAREDTFFSPLFLLKSRVCLHKINSRQTLYFGKIEFRVIDSFYAWLLTYCVSNAQNMLNAAQACLGEKKSKLNHLQRTGWCRLSAGVIRQGRKY